MPDDKQSGVGALLQATGGPQTAKPSEQTIQIHYLDRPECEEIFADSVVNLFFDGQSLRVELGVTRLDNRTSNGPISGRRYTACRLVLPPSAAVELINRVQQIGAALAQAGIVKSNTP